MHVHVAVNCGNPPPLPISNRGSLAVPTRQTLGGTVTYSCNEEYSLLGNTTSVCQANASWSSPPECNGVFKYKHTCMYINDYNEQYMYIQVLLSAVCSQCLQWESLLLSAAQQNHQLIL